MRVGLFASALFALSALACGWCSGAAAQDAAAQSGPPPAQAYGRLPEVQDVAISPDGARLVLSIASDQQTALRIYNLSTHAFETTMQAPEGNKFRGVSWAGNDRAVYFVSRTLLPHQALPYGYTFIGNPGHVEYWRVGVIDIAGMHSRLLMDDEHAFANIDLSNLTAPIEGDPGYGRMVAFSGVGIGNLVDDDPELTIFRVNLALGRAVPQTVGNRNTRRFIMNGQGQPAARLDADDTTGQWRLIGYNGTNERVLEQGATNAGVLPDPLAVMQDGRLAVFDASDDGVNNALVTYDLATGERKPLVVGDGVYPDEVIIDPWTHAAVGASWTEEFPRQFFFDATLQNAAQRLAEHFADGYAEIVSWSADKSRLIVKGEQADDAGAYYVYEPAANRLTRTALLYPELADPASLGQRASISYHARDGSVVHAYLTLPANADPHGLPLVVLVHGGPGSRDTFQFDWWASFLASRGYAVLQPNFRGSVGYGIDWYRAGQGQWGNGVMETDDEDGVVALVRNGMVDPSRVCIMGASYGGYAALAGAALTPDRYACAVSVGGISDLVQWVDWKASESGSSRSLASDWWRASIGDTNNRDHLRAISPAAHAADVRAPILLMHGVDDTVVPIDQSQRMANALRSAGKDVQLVTFANDDHWLSEPQTRVQMLQTIETFLDAHIGAHRPGAAGAAASH